MAWKMDGVVAVDVEAVDMRYAPAVAKWAEEPKSNSADILCRTDEQRSTN